MAKSKTNKYEFKAKVKLGGDYEKPPEMAAYIFDRKKQLITATPIKKNSLNFSLEKPSKGLQLVIGPDFTGDKRNTLPSFDTLRQMQAFVMPGFIDIDRPIIELPEIPPNQWTLWPLCLCRVKGRVVKRTVSANGVVTIAPVCGARVHICEVDPFYWIIPRLPDREIFRLRDDILDIIRKPWPPKLPDIIPPELPEPPKPLPDPVPLPLDVNPIDGLNFNASLFSNNISADLISDAKLDVTPATSLSPDVIPNKLKLSLTSHSATVLRKTFLDNIQILRPWICFWPWIRPWFYRCDELRTVITDDDGYFETFIVYPCNGDKPDLYFWAEYSINGAWETVYKPFLPCNVWWNYQCNTEVTLTVTDPRVPGCGERVEIPGKEVVVKTIGRQVSMGEINRAATGALEGTVKAGWIHTGKESPFGARLEPRVDFGTGLKPAGITHYRWSFRALNSGASWTVIDEPIRRHYRAKKVNPFDPTEPIVYKSEPISSGSANDYFAEIEPDLPADGDEWEILDEGYDLKSADFDTNLLLPGKYEMKLELFKQVGGNMVAIDFTTESVGLSQIDDPAPLTSGTYTTVTASGDRVIESGGNVRAYRLVVHVDNRRCFGNIEPVKLSPARTENGCGFISYEAGDQVTLRFQASHPADYGYFNFAMSRGATAMGTSSVAGLVGVTPAGYTLGGTGYEKTSSVADLMAENSTVVPNCDHGAFAQRLWVHALATNGYSRLSGLDAPFTAPAINLRAFALSLETP